MNWVSPDPPVSTLTEALPAAPPPPVPAPTHSVGSGIAGTLQGFFWAGAVCAAAGMIAALVSRSAHRSFLDADLATPARQRRLRQKWLEADAALQTTTALFIVSMIVVVILLMIWAWRLHRASDLLWSGPRRWSPGWTVGGWFVPIGNFVIPKNVLDETERILACRQLDGRTHAGWKDHTTSSAGWCWWTLYLTGVALLILRPDVPADVEQLGDAELRAFYVIHLLAMASWCASCVFAVFYVRRLTALARRASG